MMGMLLVLKYHAKRDGARSSNTYLSRDSIALKAVMLVLQVWLVKL